MRIILQGLDSLNFININTADWMEILYVRASITRLL